MLHVEVTQMLNRIHLVGRLTRDPELRYLSSGHPMAQFTVAVDRDFRNAQGERDADFIKCIAWRKLAEQVGQYCAQGRLVAVEGRLQTRSYETQDGSRRRVTEVVGDRVWFLDSRKTEAGSGTRVPTGAAADGPTEGQPEVIEDPEASPDEA
jgi:single-strand DNA-binding protein